MSVPPKRRSRSAGRRRRSHDALKPRQLSLCASCKAPALSHRACPSCGHYRGRTVK